MKERVFRFKQFAVSHSLSAMKVGVDGVLLGAWASVSGAGVAVDVGTGCGLIALALAQRNAKVRVLGIDVHEPSVREAADNFGRSPWGERLEARLASFPGALAGLEGQCDLLVSNPPFFNSGIKEPVDARQVARHGWELSPATLVAQGARYLRVGGCISQICPPEWLPLLEREAAEAGLVLRGLMEVHTRSGLAPKRIMVEFVRPGAGECVEPQLSEVTIESEPGCYTDEYKALTGDFYLAF